MTSGNLIEPSCISHCPSKISRTIKWWCHRHNSIPGITPISRLESYHPTHTRRLTNWSTSISSESSRNKSSSYRNSRSKWWTTRNTSWIPRITGRTKCTILPTSSHRKFIHICFTKRDKSSSFHTFCNSRFIWRNKIYKHLRTCSGTNSCFTKNILYSNRKCIFWISSKRLFWKSIKCIKIRIILLGSLKKIIIYFRSCCFSAFYKFRKLKKRKVFEVHFTV